MFLINFVTQSINSISQKNVFMLHLNEVTEYFLKFLLAGQGILLFKGVYEKKQQVL